MLPGNGGPDGCLCWVNPLFEGVNALETRRRFLQGAAASVSTFALMPKGMAASFAGGMAPGAGGREAALAQVAKEHEATVKLIQDWIALPSIAAEDRNYPAGPEYMAKLAREAGFTHVEVVPTAGKGGVFATWDVGAPKWVAIYFMYDVKQFDPKEWSSPPLEARLVDKPGLGKCIVGRGAVNSKGPQGALLGALHAITASGSKPPVNLVLVCEGEEEIASPHFKEIVFKPEVEAALRKCEGIMIPLPGQSPDGSVELNLGAKGVVELELVSDGATWGRGPAKDVHSSYEAQIDSPAWRLVKALNTLVGPDGHTPAVAGFFDKVKPLSGAQKAMIADAAKRRNEDSVKASLGVKHWYKDEDYLTSLTRLASQPTINIEGLVGGYTGPGGKTILPHRAVAKIDMRLVPDMTADDSLAKLKAYLEAQGFPDIQVNRSGGYDPTETAQDSQIIQAALKTYRSMGIDPIVWPRIAGSWPGVTFTGAPLHLPAAQFGLGHGSGAHAPDEYYLIDSTNPKVSGLDGAMRSYVDFLYNLA